MKQTGAVRDSAHDKKGDCHMRIMTDFSDIFLLPQGPQDAVCVTTNGMVRRDGRAVMGRGIALTADQRFGLARGLACKLNAQGNHAYDMGVRTDGKTGRAMRVLTLPTKHDWRDKSDLALIERSLDEIVQLCDALRVSTCYLTCPGCANGGLDWETQVRPICERILDDRFVVADWGLKRAH